MAARQVRILKGSVMTAFLSVLERVKRYEKKPTSSKRENTLPGVSELILPTRKLGEYHFQPFIHMPVNSFGLIISSSGIHFFKEGNIHNS